MDKKLFIKLIEKETQITSDFDRRLNYLRQLLRQNCIETFEQELKNGRKELRITHERMYEMVTSREYSLYSKTPNRLSRGQWRKCWDIHDTAKQQLIRILDLKNKINNNLDV